MKQRSSGKSSWRCAATTMARRKRWRASCCAARCASSPKRIAPIRPWRTPTMTADPFTRHGIDHISPSSLRMFKENLAVWIGRYMLRVKDEAGPRAWRGRAVEAALDQHLFASASHHDALLIAQAAFYEQAAGVADEASDLEFALLGDFLKQAMDAFKDKGMPLTRQGTIKV